MRRAATALAAMLVSACTQFARGTGCHKIVLWTQSNLVSARHLYREAGYRRVSSAPHTDFGRPLVAESRELDLRH